MAEISGESASGSATGKEPEIDDMLAHLELRDDELEDVVAEVVKEYQKEARWLAIGKVHTARSFSAEALFGKMKAIWNLSRDPICRQAGENLLIFQMHCVGDWKKIHGIPELYRKQAVIDDLARHVGKTKEVQMAQKLFFEGNYVRLRVMIDVAKPLMRFTSLSVQGEGRKRLAVKYEKIPFFCKNCGLLGHDYEECGDGVWDAKDLQYEDWMLAVRRSSMPVTEPRHFQPRAPSCGGWSGRGSTNLMAKKRSSQDASLDDEDEVKDTAASPLKPAPMDEDPDDDECAKARRKLDLDDTSSVQDGNGIPGTKTGKEEITPPPPPGYTNPRDRTKQRKTTNPGNDLATSVASLEEDRRA
ncbi:hypothetical protein ACQ4PT_034030 [Festuca glaucescens]